MRQNNTGSAAPRLTNAFTENRPVPVRTINDAVFKTLGVPRTFSEEALSEARQAVAGFEAEVARRTDARAIPFVTIDGADARDFDDAVYACDDDDPDNPGGLIVKVAIADVTHYVRPDSALERTAFERGFSIYPADRAEHMLPPLLSEDYCSLQPGCDRLAVVTTLRIDSEGAVLTHDVERAVIRSAARLIYEDVDEYLCGNDLAVDPALHGALSALDRAYEILKDAGYERGELEIDQPKIIARTDPSGNVDGFDHIRKHYSRDLIEKLMVAANSTIASDLAADGADGMLYRTHDEPCPTRVARARQRLAALGYAAPNEPPEDPDADSWSSDQLNMILAQARSEADSAVLQDIILGLISKGGYNALARPHFGLAQDAYCHITSPIRRYADLLNQRAYLQSYGLAEPEEIADIVDTHRLATHLNERENHVEAVHHMLMQRYLTAWIAQAETPLAANIQENRQNGTYTVRFEQGPPLLINELPCAPPEPDMMVRVTAADPLTGAVELAFDPIPQRVPAPRQNIAP